MGMVEDYAAIIRNTKFKKKPSKYCIWKENDDGVWEALCGKKDELLFEFNLDGPKANKFKYCPYCSKLIKEKEYKHGQVKS
jgi:hypothetical protein